MDPYIERALRDEVLYLHSLWRRGPPSHHPLSNPNIASGSTQRNDSISTINKNKKKMTHVGYDEENQNEEKRLKVSNLEWTDPSRVEKEEALESESVWPAFKLKGERALELTENERATMSARRVQERGVEAAKKFFLKDAELESESESESEDGNEKDVESEEFRFFTKLFEEDLELRELYVKNWSDGVFCCLVCRGNVEKVTKRFRNCVAVVQHSVTVSRTCRRRAHRAYGQVICHLLNWDINKLPADKLPVGDGDGLKLVESKLGDVNVLDGEGGRTEGWDVKWKTDKKPTCVIAWGQGLTELDIVPEKELSEEEKLKVAAAKLQERSREAARVFFTRDEFTVSDDESDDEDSVNGYESDECEEYKFLTKLFDEDQELTDYYKRSWGSGAFSCLVCWGSVEKLNKRYKDCVALVQHCVTISKTKRKIAHRAYGKIICKLLSWDINRLPANILPASDGIGPKSGDSQVEVQELQINAAQMVSEQHVELLENSHEKKLWQSEEPANDSNLEKNNECPQEPKVDSSGDKQLDGSKNSVSSNEVGWEPFNPRTSQSLTNDLTMVEQMKLNSIKLHQKSLDAIQAFFSRDKGSDSDDDSQEDEEVQENDNDDLNTFFTSLLEEGGELISYCQKNWENGDFSCLVCRASGENLIKKFKNLVAVVQHSFTVTKSKRIRAHRVYGEVLCKALNWDIKRLPVIPSPAEDNLCSTLANSQGDASANGENKVASVQEVSTK